MRGGAAGDFRVGAVILAAGRSSRLPGPKALCRIAGRTFLERVLEATAPPAAAARVVVVGFHAARVAAAAGEVPVVRNPAVVEGGEDPGQTSSVKAGIAALGGALHGYLVLPVDFPLVTSADVVELVAAARRAGAPLAVPSWDGRRGHPLFLAASLAPELLALPDGAPLRELTRAHAAEILHVPATHAGVLVDVDTPEELARLGGSPPPSDPSPYNPTPPGPAPTMEP